MTHFFRHPKYYRIPRDKAISPEAHDGERGRAPNDKPQASSGKPQAASLEKQASSPKEQASSRKP
jgi:hypothetical protein